MRPERAVASLGLGALAVWCAPAAAPVAPPVATWFGIPLRLPGPRPRAHLRRRAASGGNARGARPSSTGPASARPSTSSASRSSAGPALAAEIAAAGHEIGIHGYRHTLLLRRSPAALRADLDRAAAVIGEATGRREPLLPAAVRRLQPRRRCGSPASAGRRSSGRTGAATGRRGRPPASIAALATRDLGPRRCRAAARQRRLQRRRARGVRRWRRCRRCSRRRSRRASRSSPRASRRSGGRPRRSSSVPPSRARRRARAPEAWPNLRSTGRSGTCSIGTSATSSRTVSAICADADELVADEVVDAAGARRRERGDHALGEILDVDELARLAAVAGDRQRLAGCGLLDERRDDGRRAGARAVRDAEAQDRRRDAVERLVGAAVHLAGELRRRVEVRRQHERRVLVVRLGAGRVAVDPDRARVEEPADALGPRAASSSVNVPRTLTLSVRTGSPTTWLTSAIAARWKIASQPSTASRTASASVRSPITVSTSPGRGTARGRGRRSAARGRLPTSLSTTCEPMKPGAAGDESLHRPAPGDGLERGQRGGPVVERRAPVVLRDPVGVREVDRVAHHAVAGLVVDLAGRALERLEDDVLVEAGDHPLRELARGAGRAGRARCGRSGSSRRRSPRAARRRGSRARP